MLSVFQGQTFDKVIIFYYFFLQLRRFSSTSAAGESQNPTSTFTTAADSLEKYESFLSWLPATMCGHGQSVHTLYANYTVKLLILLHTFRH